MKTRYMLGCIGLGAVLATAMIVAHLGPGLQAGAAKDTPSWRNTERTQMLHDLANALTQYRHDHGNFPTSFSSANTQICESYGANCTQVHLQDLSFLTTAGNYLPTLPTDPLGGAGRWGSGFFIQQLNDGMVSLTAPKAELGQTIAVTFTP